MNKTKATFNILLLILCSIQLSAALQCYSCYSEPPPIPQNIPLLKDEDPLLCGNDTASYPIQTCPDQDQCIYMDVKDVATDHHYIVRSCVSSDVDLCDLVSPRDFEVSDCYECGTDLCNENATAPAPPPETCPSFTIDINLNINLNINN